jgi:hypothetical protein
MWKVGICAMRGTKHKIRARRECQLRSNANSFFKKTLKAQVSKVECSKED